MFGRFERRRTSTQSRFGINQIGGVERTATGLTLVAVGFCVTTLGASANHKTIGQKLLGLLVIELVSCLFHKIALVV